MQAICDPARPTILVDAVFGAAKTTMGIHIKDLYGPMNVKAFTFASAMAKELTNRGMFAVLLSVEPSTQNAYKSDSMSHLQGFILHLPSMLCACPSSLGQCVQESLSSSQQRIW